MRKSGNVNEVNGTVIAKDLDSSRIRLLKEGDKVFSGDVVQTSENSLVEIAIDDKSYSLSNGASARVLAKSPVNEDFKPDEVIDLILQTDAGRVEEYKLRAAKFESHGSFSNVEAESKETNVNDEVNADTNRLSQNRTISYFKIEHSSSDSNISSVEIVPTKNVESNVLRENKELEQKDIKKLEISLENKGNIELTNTKEIILDSKPAPVIPEESTEANPPITPPSKEEEFAKTIQEAKELHNPEHDKTKDVSIEYIDKKETFVDIIRAKPFIIDVQTLKIGSEIIVFSEPFSKLKFYKANNKLVGEINVDAKGLAIFRTGKILPSEEFKVEATNIYGAKANDNDVVDELTDAFFNDIYFSNLDVNIYDLDENADLVADKLVVSGHIYPHLEVGIYSNKNELIGTIRTNDDGDFRWEGLTKLVQAKEEVTFKALLGDTIEKEGKARANDLYLKEGYNLDNTDPSELLSLLKDDNDRLRANPGLNTSNPIWFKSTYQIQTEYVETMSDDSDIARISVNGMVPKDTKVFIFLGNDENREYLGSTISNSLGQFSYSKDNIGKINDFGIIDVGNTREMYDKTLNITIGFAQDGQFKFYSADSRSKIIDTGAYFNEDAFELLMAADKVIIRFKDTDSHNNGHKNIEAGYSMEIVEKTGDDIYTAISSKETQYIKLQENDFHKYTHIGAFVFPTGVIKNNVLSGAIIDKSKNLLDKDGIENFYLKITDPNGFIKYVPLKDIPNKKTLSLDSYDISLKYSDDGSSYDFDKIILKNAFLPKGTKITIGQYEPHWGKFTIDRDLNGEDYVVPSELISNVNMPVSSLSRRFSLDDEIVRGGYRHVKDFFDVNSKDRNSDLHDLEEDLLFDQIFGGTYPTLLLDVVEFGFSGLDSFDILLPTNIFKDNLLYVADPSMKPVSVKEAYGVDTDGDGTVNTGSIKITGQPEARIELIQDGKVIYRGVLNKTGDITIDVSELTGGIKKDSQIKVKTYDNSNHERETNINMKETPEIVRPPELPSIEAKIDVYKNVSFEGDSPRFSGYARIILKKDTFLSSENGGVRFYLNDDDITEFVRYNGIYRKDNQKYDNLEYMVDNLDLVAKMKIGGKIRVVGRDYTDTNTTEEVVTITPNFGQYSSNYMIKIEPLETSWSNIKPMGGEKFTAIYTFKLKIKDYATVIEHKNISLKDIFLNNNRLSIDIGFFGRDSSNGVSIDKHIDFDRETGVVSGSLKAVNLDDTEKLDIGYKVLGSLANDNEGFSVLRVYESEGLNLHTKNLSFKVGEVYYEDGYIDDPDHQTYVKYSLENTKPNLSLKLIDPETDRVISEIQTTGVNDEIEARNIEVGKEYKLVSSDGVKDYVVKNILIPDVTAKQVATLPYLINNDVKIKVPLGMSSTLVDFSVLDEVARDNYYLKTGPLFFNESTAYGTYNWSPFDPYKAPLGGYTKLNFYIDGKLIPSLSNKPELLSLSEIFKRAEIDPDSNNGIHSIDLVYDMPFIEKYFDGGNTDDLLKAMSMSGRHVRFFGYGSFNWVHGLDERKTVSYSEAEVDEIKAFTSPEALGEIKAKHANGERLTSYETYLLHKAEHLPEASIELKNNILNNISHMFLENNSAYNTDTASDYYTSKLGISLKTFKDFNAPHFLELEGSKPAYIVSGGGNDIIKDHITEAKTILELGAGDDIVFVDKVSGDLKIDMGDNDDVLIIKDFAFSSHSVAFNRLDESNHYSANVNEDYKLVLEGGWGKDILSVKDLRLDLDMFFDNDKNKISGFETLDISNNEQDQSVLMSYKNLIKSDGFDTFKGDSGDSLIFKVKSQAELDIFKNATKSVGDEFTQLNLQIDSDNTKSYKIDNDLKVCVVVYDETGLNRLENYDILTII